MIKHMDLSFFSRLVPRHNKRDLFLGICLTESSGICYGFEQTADDVELVQEISFQYTDGFESILDDVDKTVYTLEKALKCNFKKSLFIIPSLALGGQAKVISPTYRNAISEIMHNLDLEAMGYIEMIDCYKQLIEESHSSAYVEMGEHQTLLVFNRRNHHWKTLVVKTNIANIVSHLDEFLTKGTTLYLRTLHSSIQAEQVIPGLNQYSVTVCTDQAMHGGLLKLLKEQLLSDSQPEALALTAPAKSEDLKEDQSAGEDVKALKEAEMPAVGAQSAALAPAQASMPPIQENDFQDIVQTKNEIEGFKIFTEDADETNAPEKHLAEELISDEDSHFVAAGDISSYDKQESQSTDVEEHTKEAGPVEETEDMTEAEEEEESSAPADKRNNALQTLRSLAIVFLISLSAIMLSLAAVELFIHRVTIHVYLPTEVEEVSLQLADIPLSNIREEKEIHVSVPATGEREVGDRAKGKVIIASFADKEASFSAGTRLLLGNEPYQLDEDVVLPPASVDTSSGTKTASKKTVNASASFIGPEGNAEKNQQLTIAEYPTTLYYAMVETSFSGGTRRSVSVVSAKDISELNTLITRKGKEASDSARVNAKEDAVVLDEISSVDLSKIQYSAGQGEIASSIDAEGTVEAELYTIEKNVIVDQLTAYLKEKKGKEYEFVDNGSAYKYADLQLSDDRASISFTLDAKVKSYKTIDVGKVRAVSRLKPLSYVRQSLRDELKIQDAEFIFSPVLPLFQSFVPIRLDHIGVEIKPEKE